MRAAAQAAGHHHWQARPGDPADRHKPIHQAEPGRFPSVDQARPQQQVHRVDVIDLLDQLYGRAAERVDRPLDLGQAPRLRRSGADVGREHEFEAPAYAIAVDPAF
jgi:hypothetical protein